MIIPKQTSSKIHMKYSMNIRITIQLAVENTYEKDKHVK